MAEDEHVTLPQDGIRGATTVEKLRETKVWVPTPGSWPGWRWVREGIAPPAVVVRGCYPRKIFENSDAKSCILVASALISALVGSRGRVFSSKQQACQGLNQFQNFNFSAVVAPLVVRTNKKLS